ncbi:MAG: hypothetical protein KGI29_08920 [Pseudomonadota bacterium]|nr:hypothetical protein [Pseudomonadota bacterium]MDE3037130.1 hypothetical protein [Pseudomonadota bacterium]
MMGARNDTPFIDDDRPTIQKIMDDKGLKNCDSCDFIGGARMVTGFLPGMGQAIDLPLAVAQGNLEADKELAKREKYYGNLKSAASRSRGFKSELKNLQARWQDRLGEAATSLAGGLGGMWLGATMLAWIPIVGSIGGGLIGAVAGAYLANQLYNVVFPSQNQDATALAMTMYKMQQQGEAVSPQMAFAVLASNLPRKARARIEKDLERMTGGTSFNDAITNGRMNELAVLMKRYDIEIRADTHMKRDAVDIGKPASEQYAEWINSGRLDARTLMFTKELPTDPLAMPQQPERSLVTAPATPMMGRGMGKNP